MSFPITPTENGFKPIRYSEEPVESGRFSCWAFYVNYDFIRVIDGRVEFKTIRGIRLAGSGERPIPPNDAEIELMYDNHDKWIALNNSPSSTMVVQ